MEASHIPFMSMAIDEARKCISEPGKNSPLVGAVVVKDNKVFASGFRGELKAGDHAEYTVLECKLKDIDLTGATIYATLEPCTTRNHPKIPCAKRLLERKLKEVVVGMLDPDPRIYGNGCHLLKKGGVNVRYFPVDLRRTIEEINQSFIMKFRASPTLSGKASFNYMNNNGVHTIGHGDFIFETRWSKAKETTIYLIKNPPTTDGIGIAVNAVRFSDVIDATIFDMSSDYRRIDEGGIAVLKNKHGFFAVIHVLDVKDKGRKPKDRSQLPDERDELTFEYRILADLTSDFSVPENEANAPPDEPGNPEAFRHD